MKSLSGYLLPLLFMGLGLAILLPYAPPHFINRDSGIFLYAGREITLGKTLYTDVWDHKGPLIFYLNALGLLSGSRAGVWGLELVFLYVSTLSGYKLMKDLMGERPAIIGTLAWLFAFWTIIAGGNYTEEYSLPLGFLSILFFLRYLSARRGVYLFWIGIATALSLLLRPNNIGIQLVIALVVLLQGIQEKRIRLAVKNVCLIGLGLLAVLLPTLAFFFANGSLAEMINAAVLYNIHYAANTGSAKLAVFWFFAVLLGWPFWFAIGGWCIALKDVISKTGSMSTAVLVLLIIGFPLEIYLDTLSGRPYVHYVLSLLAYLGLLSGYFIHRLPDLLQTRHPLLRTAVTIVCLSVVGFSLWSNHEMVKKLDEASAGINENSAIISFVKENTSPADYVLVWGQELSINFLAQRSAPSSYAFQTWFYDYGTVTPAIQKKFMSDIETHPPALVLITDALPFSSDNFASFDAQMDAAPPQSTDLFRAFSAFVNRNYRPDGIVDNIRVYKLNR